MSPVKVDDYEKISEISRGAYADVYRVRAKASTEGSSTATEFFCDAKFIKLSVQQQNKNGPDLQKLVDENKELCSLSHKNLVKLIDMKAVYAECAIAVFMELFDGRDLASLIQSSGALDEAKIITISIQVCTALEYLHSKDIIHRNINSGTVIIAQDNVVKLVDFGLSIQLLDATSHHSLGPARGLPQYMAPEVFLVEETEKSECHIYSRGSDIWAFGCVVYEMASGKKPYEDCRNMLAIVHQVKEGCQPDLPAQCSDALKDFYASCMARDRHERMPVTDLLKHDFLLQGTGSESRSQMPDSSNQPLEKYKEKYATEGLSGMCLVISIDSHGSDSPNPKNTKQDAEQIEKVFESLGFEVKSLENPDSNELWTFLHDVVTNQVTTECGCLVCFILAPGENGLVISKDGSEIEIRDVVGKFLSTQCPNLKAKPKLFFVETERCSMVQTDTEDDFSFRLREKDFLVCNVALGNSDTSFVKTLCNVLESQFKDREVESILGEVTDSLSIKVPIRKDQRFCTSSSEIVSSLSMTCFLNFSSNFYAFCETLPKDWSDEQLLEKINSLTEANKRFGPMKQTLLIIAAIRGRADFVKVLLEKVPGDIGAQDVRGRTALCWAAHKGHEAVLTEFEKAFASDAETLKAEVNRADFVKQTPIILAAKRHRPITVIDQLKRIGADLDSVDTVKFSAATYAASQGFADTLGKLLALKASAKLPDFLGNSPLIWAARNGHADVVEVLGECLNDSSDVTHWNMTGERGMDARQWAEYKGHLELAGRIDEIIRKLPTPVSEPFSGGDIPPISGPGSNDGGRDQNGGQNSGRPGDTGGREGDGGASGGGQGGGSQGGGNGGDRASGGNGRRNAGGPGNQAARLDRYPMTSPPKRLAIILDILEFRRLQNRLWSEGQTEGLIQRLRQLGFTYRLFRNVTRGMFQVLRTNCLSEAYRNAEAFLVCILSHGRDGLVYDCEDNVVLLDSVFNQFKTCEFLREKPKIFIVQAGREISNERFNRGQAGRLEGRDQKDCLCVYSCVKGASSDSFGAPPRDLLIQELVATLGGYDPELEEFVSVLPRVNQSVAHESNGTQVSCFESTLGRKLYFWPT